MIFDIQANYPQTGWNGTANDNRYIDNSGTGNQSEAASFSIKTTSNLFKANKFWVYVSAANLDLTVAGTLTVTGKLSGVTKFTQTKSSGFTTSISPTNGYTLIDLTNLNGQNYSNIIVDEIQLTLGGSYQYIALDAFTWVKDSGIVLAASEVKSSKKEISIYPNPTSGPLSIKTEKATDAQVYGMDGKLVKTLPITKGINNIDISELPKGTYILKTSTESSKIIKN
jgi:hypothetical protein